MPFNKRNNNKFFFKYILAKKSTKPRMKPIELFIAGQVLLLAKRPIGCAQINSANIYQKEYKVLRRKK